MEWTWSLERDLDSVVGLRFSYSCSAPAQFADEAQRAAFERDLRTALSARFGERTFREEIRTEALVATRPGDPGPARPGPTAGP